MVLRMNQSLDPKAAESIKATRHWLAHLALEFTEQNHRTELAHARHQGPLRIQRLFYPDDDGKAHCYLLHPPGGVVLGDELSIDVHLRDGKALLTTPSAGRFYDVATFTEPQVQRVNLRVDKGLLEWLPQETILFSGANARLLNFIDLSATAKLAFWDIVVLGKPASGDRFDTGALEQRLSIRRDGRPALEERVQLCAGDDLSRASIGLANASTLGIAVFTGELRDEAMEQWLVSVNNHEGVGDFSLSQRGEFLIARYRGEDAQRCRLGFTGLWRRLGAEQNGWMPAEPRIWHT